MLDYDGHIIFKLTNVTFSFILQPNNISRHYFAQKYDKF